MADQKRTSTKCGTSHDSDGVKLGPAERWNAIVRQIEEKAIKDAEVILSKFDRSSISYANYNARADCIRETLTRRMSAKQRKSAKKRIRAMWIAISKWRTAMKV
jgi:hypothetical protein